MKRSSRLAALVLCACALVPAGLARASTDNSTPVATAPTVDSVTATPDSNPVVQTTTTSTLPPLMPRPRARIPIAFSRIVLSEQRAYFYNARKRLIATLPVSTGADNQTPVGSFKVFSKSASTFYTPDPAERMRWMTRFTRGSEGGAIGFHGIPYRVTKNGEIPIFTPLGQYPVSHGCIRVRVSDAKWIFENMKIGTVVTVVRSRQ